MKKSLENVLWFKKKSYLCSVDSDKHYSKRSLRLLPLVYDTAPAVCCAFQYFLLVMLFSLCQAAHSAGGQVKNRLHSIRAGDGAG